MKNIYRIGAFTALLLFSCFSAFAQTKGYKRYSNQIYKFSFDMPASWQVKYSKEQEGFICVPTAKSEKEMYSDCFEGIVFRMEMYKASLDSVLLLDGLYTKEGDVYYTSDRESDTIRAKTIRGKNWVGIYHNNICGISCKETGFHAVAGQCEFLYFSNGKKTILITTNGREFDDSVLKQLISSFTFN